MVTVAPLTVQTEEGVEVNITGSPELASAEMVTGAAPKVTLAGAAKVMVWVAVAMVKLCTTGTAAPKPALPG